MRAYHCLTEGEKLYRTHQNILGNIFSILKHIFS